MIKVGKMWVNEGDDFFIRVFRQTGNKFEYNQFKTVLSKVKNRDTFIDVGAHYGSWSIHMAEQFDKVLAFEPVYTNYQCLEKNTEGIDNIEIYNKAVGEKADKVDVGLGKRRPKKVGSNTGIFTVIGPGDIEMITIDSLNLDSVGLIKIDVEGYELFVMKGAEETIRRNKPVIVFEENIRGDLEHNVKIGECGKFLEGLGAKRFGAMGENLFYKFS